MCSSDLEGVKKSDYRMDFYLPAVLEPNTNYEAEIQIQSPTGEKSAKTKVRFQTVPVTSERIWVEIIVGANHELVVYKGKEEVKRMICSGGSTEHPTLNGTFYLQAKGESHYDDKANEGGNYAMQLSEGIIIHGMSRDQNWELKSSVYNRLGEGQTFGKIVLKEEDAKWLYETLPVDTMVIIHK